MEIALAEPALAKPDVVRQHLIDPVMCVRCGACEAACPNGAISLVDINFVVDPQMCDGGSHCLPGCPTNAISHWLAVERHSAYSPAEQATWDALPDEAPALAALAGEEAAVHPAPPAPPSAATPALMTHLAPAPATGIVEANLRATALAAGSAVHHLVIAIDDPAFSPIEGQSVGVIAPGVDETGNQHQMRLYSVASPREGESGIPGHMALTVKRVLADPDGNPVHGVCSNYLCDTAPGDRVQLVGPFGDAFLMPQDPAARLLMIATGTGIAPMRGFIEYRRRHQGAGAGQTMLFYGGRTRDELAYADELAALAQAGAIDLHLALSRAADQPRRYVQDALRDRMAEIAGLLADPRGHVFACGVRGLEQAVLDAFQQCCTVQGLNWEILHETMRAEGRIHFESY